MMLEKTLVVSDYEVKERYFKDNQDELEFKYYSLDQTINIKNLKSKLNTLDTSIDSVLLVITHNSDQPNIDDSDGEIKNQDENDNEHNNEHQDIQINENEDDGASSSSVSNNIKNLEEMTQNEIGFTEGKYNTVIQTILDKLRSDLQTILEEKQKNYAKPNGIPYFVQPKKPAIPKLGILIVSNEELDFLGKHDYLVNKIESNLPFLQNITKLKGMDIIKRGTSFTELQNRLYQIQTENSFPWDYEISMETFSQPTLHTTHKKSSWLFTLFILILIGLLFGLIYEGVKQYKQLEMKYNDACDTIHIQIKTIEGAKKNIVTLQKEAEQYKNVICPVGNFTTIQDNNTKPENESNIIIQTDSVQPGQASVIIVMKDIVLYLFNLIKNLFSFK